MRIVHKAIELEKALLWALLAEYCWMIFAGRAVLACVVYEDTRGVDLWGCRMLITDFIGRVRFNSSAPCDILLNVLY